MTMQILECTIMQVSSESFAIYRRMYRRILIPFSFMNMWGKYICVHEIIDWISIVVLVTNTPNRALSFRNEQLNLRHSWVTYFSNGIYYLGYQHKCVQKAIYRRRTSWDRLISTKAFPVLVSHLYIESGPRRFLYRWIIYFTQASAMWRHCIELRYCNTLIVTYCAAVKRTPHVAS